MNMSRFKWIPTLPDDLHSLSLAAGGAVAKTDLTNVKHKGIGGKDMSPAAPSSP
jgi:hypothetical protein